MKRRNNAVVYLHVGAAKTGTSALQAAFAKNVEPLRACNIHYPDDHSLALARADRVTSGNGVALAAFLGADVGAEVGHGHLVAEITEARERDEDLLYSSEAIGVLDPDRAAVFKQLLKDLGYRLKVVAYLRSFADHALSTYHQHIKGGLTERSLDDFIRYEYGRPQLSLAGTLSEVFERSELLFRNYDTAKRDLFRDFLTHVLRIRDLSGFATARTIVNRSLSDAEIAVLRVMAPMFENAFQARVASDSIIYGLAETGRSARVSSSAIQTLDELYGDDVAALNRFVPSCPIGLKSDDLVVSDEPAPRLSETERVLAAMIAGVIRTARLDTYQ